MTERLTPLDATFLELEQEDDSAHMHIGGALIFDPRLDGSTPTIEELRALLEERLGRLPRYRRRLSEPRTSGLQLAGVGGRRALRDGRARPARVPSRTR